MCLAHYLAQKGRPKTDRYASASRPARAPPTPTRFVETLGRQLDLAVVVVKAAVLKRARQRSKGRGRRARAALRGDRAQAKRLRCGVAAVGHQLDDQAETVLLHLLRGTRLSALAAMSPSRPLVRGVRLVRPLLPLRREEVEEYLRQHDLRSRLDRSNLSMEFTRNWLRREIIPALAKRQPQVREHLAGIAAQVQALTLPQAR